MHAGARRLHYVGFEPVNSLRSGRSTAQKQLNAARPTSSQQLTATGPSLSQSQPQALSPSQSQGRAGSSKAQATSPQLAPGFRASPYRADAADGVSRRLVFQEPPVLAAVGSCNFATAGPVCSGTASSHGNDIVGSPSPTTARSTCSQQSSLEDGSVGLIALVEAIDGHSDPT
jgi:hypothetical protein